MVDVNDLIDIMKEAGKELLLSYARKDFEIGTKNDGSVFTSADITVNEIITKRISSLSSFPIVSEEGVQDNSLHKESEYLWLIDPLDGTKDFINGRPDFTINVALIKYNEPIFGIIFVPIHDDIYYASKGAGSFKNGDRIYSISTRNELIALESFYHSSTKNFSFYQKNNIANVIKYGSSLKFCKIAEGAADVYLRLSPTMEWDTAAGQIILTEAGGNLIDLTSNKPLIYNKETRINNNFIAYGHNVSSFI